ncbi:MAG: hypothetical protein ACYC0H_21440, partial [Solirubrobacteraceae bacterium]
STRSTESVTPTGSVTDSQVTAALPAGTYSYRAAYSGDSDYGSSQSTCVQFTVGPATPAAALAVQDAATSNAWSGTEVTGSKAFASASLRNLIGGFVPTGSIAYRLFSGATCDGTPLSTDAHQLDAGNVPPSVTTAALAAGRYSFRAQYSSGDGNYVGVQSKCESITVGAATPSLSVSVWDHATGAAWSGSEVTGARAFAAAAVGALVAGFTPTGNVSYAFYDGPGCGGTPVATDTVTLSNGAAVGSTVTAGLGGGAYSFAASFQSGDGNYGSVGQRCADFSVGTATAALSQAVSDAASAKPWSGTELTGASAYDAATLSGLVSGFHPTGTVSYAAYAGGVCRGASLSDQTEALHAGVVAPSDMTAPLAAGEYSYQAAYSGDRNYTPLTGTCERFTVARATASLTQALDAAQPSGVTAGSSSDAGQLLGVVPGFTPSGSVTYSFFADNGCTGTPATTSRVRLSSDGTVPGSPTQASLASGSYSYTVSYSGDRNYVPAQTGCVQFNVAQAPSATISSPAAGGVYALGQVVPTSFRCLEGSDAPGLVSCTDSSGATGGAGKLDTSTLGRHTYSVTARSRSGQTATATVSYTVSGGPGITIQRPAEGATYTRGQRIAAQYSCAEGAEGPGLTGCSGSVASGAPFDTMTPGAHTFSVTATSSDGQLTTVAVHYRVALPSNRFTLSDPKLAASGAVSFVLTLPGSGQLAAVATAMTVGSRGSGGAGGRPGPARRVQVGSLHRRVIRSGRIRVVVAPGGAGRRLIADRPGSLLWISVRITYRPTWGVARRLTISGLRVSVPHR